MTLLGDHIDETFNNSVFGCFSSYTARMSISLGSKKQTHKIFDLFFLHQLNGDILVFE